LRYKPNDVYSLSENDGVVIRGARYDTWSIHSKSSTIQEGLLALLYCNALKT